MVTISQRIEALRMERNLSRPALAEALGFPKTAIEKFETGRATPTKEQQERMADYFGVSLFYLRGESGDRTRQDAWLEGDFSGDVPEAVVSPTAAPKKAPPGTGAPARGQGTLFDSFLASPQFRDLLRAVVLEVLRSPEGEERIAQIVRKELLRQK